jgi:hypothetical protein
MFCFLIVCTFYQLSAHDNANLTVRQQLMEQEEQNVASYIQANIDAPLPESVMQDFIHGFDDAEHGLKYSLLSEEEKSLELLAFKKAFLRFKYFEDHPEAWVPYQAEMAPVCLNGSFEFGNFSNYQGNTAFGNPGGYVGGECGAIPTTGFGNFAWTPENLFSTSTDNFDIVSAGNDPIVAAGGQTLSMINPNSPTTNNQFAARVNGPRPLANPTNPSQGQCWADRGINRLTKPITLTESGNQTVRFYYALVTEFPDHPNRNPIFVARALDGNNAELDRLCVISNPAGNPFFNQLNGINNGCSLSPVLWQDWTCAELKISGDVGDVINLEFIVADCGAGRHFGYAYIDDICAEECLPGSNFQGSIRLNEFDACEVTLPFDVCAEFTLPQLNGQTGTLTANNTSLDILQNGQVVATLTNGVITGNTVCFNVTPSDFPSQTGGYDFQVNADFGIAGQTQSADDVHTTPGQNNDYIFNNPECCDIGATISNVVCDDQGTTDPSDDTWSFDLTVTNSGGTFWNATTPDGDSGGYGTTSTIYMGNISAYSSVYGFQISDDADPSCSIILTVSVPDPCSPPCELQVEAVVGECDNNGTPADTSDDFYYVTVTVTGTNGLPWMAKQKLESNGAEIVLDNVTGDVTSYQLGPIDVSDGNWTLWIGLTDYFDCLIDIFIEVPECCTDEPYISPYWQHPDCPEVVCTADQWPIHILSSDGTPITSAGGIMITWDNLDTPIDENIQADWIYTQPLQNWQATIKYPDGCEYVITYYEDCCDEDIFIRVLDCPSQEQVVAYAASLEKLLEQSSGDIRKADVASSEQQAQIQNELNLLNDYLVAVAESNGEDCDPCDLEIVFIELVDADGNVIDPNDYATFSWSDGGFGAMRSFPLPMAGPVCFTATNIEFGNECVYQDCFFYECPDPCEVATSARYDCRSGVISWTGDPSFTYIIEVNWDDSTNCRLCKGNKPTSTRWETQGNSFPIPYYVSGCFSWRIGTKCEEDVVWTDYLCSDCFSLPSEPVPSDVPTSARISPNPNDGNMNIEITGQDKTDFSIKVYRFDGILIKAFNKKRIENNITTITWNGKSVLSPGIYFFVITTDKETITKKVIIE